MNGSQIFIWTTLGISGTILIILLSPYVRNKIRKLNETNEWLDKYIKDNKLSLDDG